MHIFTEILGVVLEAVFPIPRAEREVLAMGAASAFKSLPRATNAPIHEACSIFSYKDERVWRLIWAIKYKKSRAAAEIGAYALARVLGIFAQAAGPILVVPMPITSKRRRERGYNQCELIVDELEKIEEAGIKINGGGQLNIVRDLFLRTRHKSRQTLKDRSERLESAKNLFAVNDSVAEKLKSAGWAEKLVIVIDDVITTGSTMKEAVETLRRAGFANTYGLSIAH